MHENLFEVNEKNWREEVLESDIPVIVDFWAEWCPPCRMIAPVFEELSKEYKGKLKFAKLDTDKNQTIAVKYGVMSIPTLSIFHKGRPVERIVGAVPKDHLKSKIDSVLRNLD
jgi:thioredoxin 1